MCDDLLIKNKYGTKRKFLKEYFNEFTHLNMNHNNLYLSNGLERSVKRLMKNLTLLEVSHNNCVHYSFFDSYKIQKDYFSKKIFQMKDFVSRKRFCTLDKIMNEISLNELNDFGADEYFYVSLMLATREIRKKDINGHCIFCVSNVLPLEDLIWNTLKNNNQEKYDIYEMLEKIESITGILLSVNIFKKYYKEEIIYYNDVMHQVYINKKIFYKEIK